MILRGTLAVMSLPDVLQWLGNARKTGVLELQKDRVTTRIFYRDGKIVACSSEDPPKLLGQYLLFNGEITEDLLRESLATQEATGKGLEEILVELQAVSAEVMEKMVASKAQQTMLSLFELQEAGFTFTEDVEPHSKAMALDLAVQDLLLRGMKRLDDKAQISERFSLDDMPRQTEKLPPLEIIDDWPTCRIYQAADGRRTVREIALMVHGIEFVVCEKLLGLLHDGYIEFTKHEQDADSDADNGAEVSRNWERFDIKVVRQLLTEGEYKICLEMLSAAVRQDPTDTAICSLLSEVEHALVSTILREGLTPAKVPVSLVAPNVVPGEEISPEEEFILSLSNGEWDVKSMIWVAPMRAFEVISTVKSLWERGLIELRDTSYRLAEPYKNSADELCGNLPG